MSRRPPTKPRPLRLAVVLVLPALLFAGIWRWSLAVAVPPTPDAVTAESLNTAPTPANRTAKLATPLTSMRRSPDLIIDDLVAQRSAAAEAPLRDALNRLVGDDSCVLIVDDDGDTVFDHRSSAPLVPASNQKLFVAAAALDQLGPDTTLNTEVRGAAPVNGTVGGPLYLVGGGDPLLSTDEFALDNGLAEYKVATLDGLVMQLIAAGVSRVGGDIIGVDARYDGERRVSDWSAAITGYDVPPLGSLVVDDGLDGAGSVPVDPTLTAAQLFRRKLTAAGITVDGNSASSTDPDAANGAGVLATATSPPMATIINEMLELSDNLTAELLLKETGLVAGGEGSSAAGITVINELLSKWGVPADGVVLTDGSGLSRANRTTCATLVDLLESDPGAGEIIDDLPVAGRSGTLHDALIGSPAEGAMQAKTGTLNGVKALSGVQPDAAGSDVFFSVILNGPDRQLPSNYDPVWRAVADLIAAHDIPIQIDRAAFAPRVTQTGAQ